MLNCELWTCPALLYNANVSQHGWTALHTQQEQHMKVVVASHNVNWIFFYSQYKMISDYCFILHFLYFYQSEQILICI